MTTRNKARSNSLRWLEHILLLTGLACVAAWTGSNLVLYSWQAWENRAFDREVQQPVVSLPEKRAPAHDALIGRLTIPRLDVRTIVREGAGQDVLGLAAGHIPGTALPGEKGNVGIAGHRDTLFRGLRSIRQGDRVQFETLSGRYFYTVSSIQIVKPGDVDVLRPGPDSELTLVTCYPFDYLGSAPDRFVVKARQTDSDYDAADQAPENPPKRGVSNPGGGKISFNISRGHSRPLIGGISMGVTGLEGGRVNGWLWLMPDRRTVWLRDLGTAEPLVFYGYQDGRRRELWITKVRQDEVTGYLLTPSD